LYFIGKNVQTKQLKRNMSTFHSKFITVPL
jgi:hypothetical protein